MARARTPAAVKLICGMLSSDADLLRRARQMLVRRHGPVDLESPLWPFRHSDYYDEEMGKGLQRQFLAFERLVQPDALAGIKVETNAIEDEIADDCVGLLDAPRPVNLDPGYVDLAKLVLATTKDRSHRIYLSHGVYAEVTLYLQDQRWQISPWTYADYREPHYHEFLHQVRQRLQQQRAEPAALAAPRESDE